MTETNDRSYGYTCFQLQFHDKDQNFQAHCVPSSIFRPVVLCERKWAREFVWSKCADEWVHPCPCARTLLSQLPMDARRNAACTESLDITELLPVRGCISTKWHCACSAVKALGQSALGRTKELARQTLSQINHPCLLPNTLNMHSVRICWYILVSWLEFLEGWEGGAGDSHVGGGQRGSPWGLGVYNVVISQTHWLVSQERLSPRAGTSIYLPLSNHAIW